MLMSNVNKCYTNHFLLFYIGQCFLLILIVNIIIIVNKILRVTFMLLGAFKTLKDVVNEWSRCEPFILNMGHISQLV